MLDKNLITKKLNLIQGYISELEPIVELDENAILDDKLKCHTAERLFQLLVDTMIDINTHIIRTKILCARMIYRAHSLFSGKRNFYHLSLRKK